MLLKQSWIFSGRFQIIAVQWKVLVWDFFTITCLFFLSLYLKNWWSHLHSLAWTDGVIHNKILNSILKRIISAPIPCKGLSCRQQGKASDISILTQAFPRGKHCLSTGRSVSAVALLELRLQLPTLLGIYTGQGWKIPAGKRASSCICLRIFSWELGVLHLPSALLLDAVSPLAGDAQSTAV